MNIWEVLLVFISILSLLLVLSLGVLRSQYIRGAIARRLNAVPADDESAPQWQKKLSDKLFWQSFHSKDTQEFLGWLGFGGLRERLHKAGRHDRSAVIVYMFTKVGFIALALLILAFISFTTNFLAQPASIRFLVIFFFILLGFYIPTMLLNRQQKEFQREIYRSLPIFLNLMGLCFTSGYTVDNALKEVALTLRETHPVFANEIALTYSQLQLEVDRSKAWQRLIDHTDVVEVESVVRILQRNEQLGSEIMRPLTQLAERIRRRHYALIDQKIERLPIYLTLTVLLFFFPIMIIFIVAMVYFNVLDVMQKFIGITNVNS